jgi:signal recognition particle receptor subunit beta
MPSIDVKKKRIDAKVVYYGPGRSGKTENLRYIYEHLREDQRGRFASLPTKADPDLSIDVLPVKFGTLIGFETVFHLCAGPGRAFSNNTRKLLLRDSDGIVFVADSQPGRQEANIDSLLELEHNLREYGVQLRGIPHVIEYGKADLSDALSPDQLRAELNRYGVPDFAASTRTGQGIMDALRTVVDGVSKDLRRRL